VQLFNGLGVKAKILLATDKDDGQSRAKVKNFGDPLQTVSGLSCTQNSKTCLFLNVVERVGRVDSKANQDDVRVGIRQWTETVVVFLTSGIPQGKLDVFAVNLDIGDVVFKNSWDVDLMDR
jgi:hypothetical protein